ncbi:MAG: amidohydrolase, partial [Fimbriimonadaceae bacterium]
YNGQPRSMLVVDGRIVQVGHPDLFEGTVGERIDLRGRHVLPGFVDAHCHILPTGLDLMRLNLGACRSQEEVLDQVRDGLGQPSAGPWLMAVHYDQTRFADGRHITRDQLDALDSARPILLRHVSGHAGVANTAALVAAGVAENEPDPPGGAFGRDASGRLTGVLLEKAHERVTAAAPDPTPEEMVDAVLRAGRKMRSMGIVAAADMLTGRFGLEKELDAYRQASQRGCEIGLVLYVSWSKVFGPRAMAREAFADWIDALSTPACRIAGIKIFADGAIGSGTAAIYGRYESDGGSVNGEAITSGQLIYAPERLNDMVRAADEAGFPVAIHAIGNYATDLVMDAFSDTPDPTIHRIEHAMMLSDGQIDRMARLGVSCSMQPEFLIRFGHSYRRQLGPTRSSRLKRFRSLLNAGVPLSFGSDMPIVAGDPWDGIHAASSRPPGFDPAENLTRREAIDAYTREAARVCGLPCGTLEPKAWATYQVYDEDPMTAPRPKPAQTVVESLRG